jgi:hypothetical protein
VYGVLFKPEFEIAFILANMSQQKGAKMTLSIMTFIKMPLSILSRSIMTLNIATLTVTELRIRTLS